MDTNELQKLISSCLQDFYERRIRRLEKLKLNDFLRRKNPYLFKALGTQKASEIIEKVLVAYIGSSDETIFGEAFFVSRHGRFREKFGMRVTVTKPVSVTVKGNVK